MAWSLQEELGTRNELSLLRDSRTQLCSDQGLEINWVNITKELAFFCRQVKSISKFSEILVYFRETYSACLESESVKKTNKSFKEYMVFTTGKGVKKKKSQWIWFLISSPVYPTETSRSKLEFRIYNVTAVKTRKCAQFCMRIARRVRKTLSLWFHNLLRQETKHWEEFQRWWQVWKIGLTNKE